MFVFCLLLVNIIAFLLYGIDKFKAKKSMWRIPERVLIIIALVGGSLGALVGMYFFRHKTQHKKFFISLPLIFILHLLILFMLSKKTKDLSCNENRDAMRIEADSFLKKMDPKLQHKQAMAIDKAIKGDATDLNAVRNARNKKPQISANVNVRKLPEFMVLYEPSDSKGKTLPVLVYLHGGGWTIGSINSCGRFCDAVASSGAAKVLALDYRLAPEHPFPEGLQDCVNAVLYVRENHDLLGIDTSRVTVGGDSSGGNLAIATALSEECAGKIESLLLFYPVTKAFNDGSGSWLTYANGYGLDAEVMSFFNKAYLLNSDSTNTHISVGLCDDDILARIPRTLMVAAERDILCDQGREFAERLGEKCKRVAFPGSVHLFITVPGQETAFRKAVALTEEFISRK